MSEYLLELGGDERTGTGLRVEYRGAWPPPESLKFRGRKYRRISYSMIESPYVIRGAKYLVDAGEGDLGVEA
jgi:hypothetical protein